MAWLNIRTPTDYCASGQPLSTTLMQAIGDDLNYLWERRPVTLCSGDSDMPVNCAIPGTWYIAKQFCTYVPAGVTRLRFVVEAWSTNNATASLQLYSLKTTAPSWVAENVSNIWGAGGTDTIPAAEKGFNSIYIPSVAFVNTGYDHWFVFQVRNTTYASTFHVRNFNLMFYT